MKKNKVSKFKVGDFVQILPIEMLYKLGYFQGACSTLIEVRKKDWAIHCNKTFEINSFRYQTKNNDTKVLYTLNTPIEETDWYEAELTNLEEKLQLLK